MDDTVTTGTPCVIRGTAPGHTSRQGTDYAPAISAETVGSRFLWFGKVTLAPGQRTRAHVHERHESAFFLLSGSDVELWTGERLERRETAQSGDYLFVPAGMPHVAVNRGGSPAVFIGVRNEPTAQESVLMRPELDGRVP